MSDDLASLSLSHEVIDAQLAEDEAYVTQTTQPDPWLERRGYGFGCSDLPALFVALGIESGEGAPDYITDRARTTNRTRGVARIFAEKAGVVAPLKVGPAALKGTKRETELLRHWQTLLRRRVYYGPHEALYVPGSLGLAEHAPKRWYPLVDRHCPRLTDTPDSWILDALDGMHVVQAKCSATEKPTLPWWWALQVQGEVAVQAADGGVLVCGEMWSAWHGNDGPVRSWPVERCEASIARIRAAVAEGWSIVERLRAARTEAA
jgi:hypothetical protein